MEALIRTILIMFKAMFEKFKLEFLKSYHQGLPGKKGQLPLKPYLKISKSMEPPKLGKPRYGAVIALIYAKQNIPYIALIERSRYDGVHSGQIAFPGGKIEKNEYPLQAALRETHEEIGVSLLEKEVIGPLTDVFVWASNFLVHPFVAFREEQPAFICDEREVEHLMEIPLEVFFQENIIKERKMKSKLGITLNAPYFDLDGKILWGATAMMISELRSIILRSRFVFRT